MTTRRRNSSLTPAESMLLAGGARVGAELERSPSGLRGLAPVVSSNARLLILGSFPSAQSLKAQQYYANPRNQFWTLLGCVVGVPLVDLRYAARLAKLTQCGIALWDAIVACDRPGSLDADIRNAEPADVLFIRTVAPRIACVAFNGARAARATRRWQAAGYLTLALPSSSPAHTQAIAKKLAHWQALAQYLDAP